jgi:hypothetical protein
MLLTVFLWLFGEFQRNTWVVGMYMYNVRHNRTIGLWLSDCSFFLLSDYRNIEHRIGEFKKLSEYRISDLGLNLSDYRISDSEKTIGCPLWKRGPFAHKPTVRPLQCYHAHADLIWLDGPFKLHFKWSADEKKNINVWFQFFVFPKMILRCLVISKTELLCSVSQFPHSCISEWFIYSHDQSAYFARAKWADQSWEYINRSQRHMNVGIGNEAVQYHF